jgi:hypothetical protein
LRRGAPPGKTWTRLAPHKEIIPLGAAGKFDSHTCYAAPPMLHPGDPKTTLLYYSGASYLLGLLPFPPVLSLCSFFAVFVPSLSWRIIVRFHHEGQMI